jgi:hypothetical protein
MPGPDVWGPPGWKFIHYVTMGYPNNPSEETKKKYYNYFHALKHVIPCGICASHFTENLEKLPLSNEVLSSRENLMKWGIDMHNFVNKKNKKKVFTYTEAMLLIMGGFDNIGSKPTKLPEPEIKIVEKFVETNNIYPLLTAVIIIIVLIAIIIILINKK